MKKIGIPVMSKHITSLGGIGYFISSLIDLLSDKYSFDLLVDRPVNSNDIPFENLKGINIYWPNESLSYSYSNSIDMFMQKKVPIEVSVNFYRVMSETFRHTLYDYILINSIEAVPGVLHSNIHTLVKTSLYTHDSTFYDYLDSDIFYQFGEIYRCFEVLDIITQTKKFKHKNMNIQYVPMSNKEFRFFNSCINNTEPNTAYYCGRLCVAKRPEDFVEYCKNHGKKALVITNEKGKKWFSEEFKKNGIDFEIKTNIFGLEKIQFISRGEICFHPSKDEFYPYAVLEALYFMPVLTKESKWIERFPGGILNTNHHARDYVNDYFNIENQIKLWDDVFSQNIKLNKTSSKVTGLITKYLDEHRGFKIKDYWTHIVSRNIPSFLDAMVLYKALQDYEKKHDENGTSIGIIQDKSIMSFFED